MAAPKRRTTATSSRHRAIAHGYRSGLEEAVGDQLSTAGVTVEYETLKVHFTPPIKVRSYTPDFVLPNGIIVETKGRFLTDDRQKHKHIKAQHPDLDIRFVFSRASQRLSKGSPTTYSAWCLQYGFDWAEGLVPHAWIKEPPNPVRFAAIEKAAQK